MFSNRTIKVMALIAIIALFAYFEVRLFYFIIFSYTMLERAIALALLMGESHALHHAWGFVLNIISLQSGKYKIPHVKLITGKEPWVAVIVPVKNEPSQVVEQTLITLYSLNYPKKNIYLLDGSDDKKIISKYKQFAKKYKIHYKHVAKSTCSKAQTINHFLSSFNEKYLAIFDADQNPLPNFIIETVQVAESDNNLAFVQTPQLYSNIDVSPIAKGAAMQQSIFYESICEAKSTQNAIFCCGTNVLIRTKVLQQINGFDESSVTEDFSSSIDIHSLGYRSFYLNKVLTFGMAPESLPSYIKQQNRWAMGTTGVLRKLLKTFIKKPHALSTLQWWEYSLSASYYFVGWAFFLLMICPILFLLFGVPSYFMRPEIYIMTFIPYYLMTLLLYYNTMRSRHYSFSSVVYGIIMSSLFYPVFMSATISGLLNHKTKFLTTPKGKADKLAFWQLWPWNLMIILNIAAIGVNIPNWYNLSWPIYINMGWCVYHIAILLMIYRLNKVPKLNKDPLYAV
jgi:cellulose synthase (UDP-forming)